MTGINSQKPGPGRTGGLGSLRKAATDNHSPEDALAESAPAVQATSITEFKGTVLKEIFSSKDDKSPFTVYAVMPAGGGREESLTIEASPKIAAGEKFVAHGSWEDYKGRRQFRAAAMLQEIPRETLGIMKWLKSKAVSGVGQGTAERLAKHFGNRLAEVVGDAEALGQAGIKPEKASAIANAWNTNAEHPTLIAFLASLGFPAKAITRIIAEYGPKAKTIVETDPWCLAGSIAGVGFVIADRAGLAYGHPRDCEQRLASGITFVLNEITTRKGDCGLPRPKLLAEASRILGVPEQKLAPVLDRLTLSSLVVEDTQVGLVYPQPLFSAEQEFARAVVHVLDSARHRKCVGEDQAREHIRRAEQECGRTLSDEQGRAALVALTNPLSLITGGPGTGKSTAQKVVCRALANLGLKSTLAGPTGKSAKRLAETTGLPAQTLHRTLEYSLAEGGFMRHGGSPLETDWLKIDETSMCDITMMAASLDALPENACATFIGDADQLESVGPGKVLKDLITSGVVPLARLTENRRTGSDSGIPTAAQRINAGRLPLQAQDEKLPGFSHLDLFDTGDILQSVVDLVTRQLPEQGWDPLRDIQVLASQRKGEVGIHALNDTLKAYLNPALDEDPRTVTIRKRTFTVGDRVMQTRNNYDKSITNGESGTVIWVGATSNDEGESIPSITVDFSGAEVTYAGEEVDELDPSWAVTVHKSQGCEFPVVILLAPREHSFMLTRRLIYTGVTRSRSECILIGDNGTIQRAVRTDDREIRHTGLDKRLLALAPHRAPPKPVFVKPSQVIRPIPPRIMPVRAPLRAPGPGRP
jgi:exodeoxyribonuclease V alpha subunit